MSNVLPVRLHHAPMSRAKPGSEAETSITAPSFISRIVSNTFMMGPGHCMPLQSMRMLAVGMEFASTSTCPLSATVAFVEGFMLASS